MLLLSPWLLGERISRRDLAFLGALAAGLTLFFLGTEPSTTTATDPLLGNVLAVASGLGWALTVLGIRWLGRADADAASGNLALQATLFGNVLACAVSLPWALPLPTGTVADWGAIAFLGVVQIGIAYSCLTRAARSVPAMELALLLLLEPVLSAVWAWTFHGERPAPWSLASAATILAATALHAARRM